MSDQSKAGRSPGDAADEAFAAQVLRYLDGEAGPQDLSDLREELGRDPERRTTFVRLCRLHGELTEMLAPARARVRGGPGGPFNPGEPARAEPPAADAAPPAAAPDDTAFHPRDEGDETRH